MCKEVAVEGSVRLTINGSYVNETDNPYLTRQKIE